MKSVDWETIVIPVSGLAAVYLSRDIVSPAIAWIGFLVWLCVGITIAQRVRKSGR
ncbi:MAG: hypothetical protein AAF958_13320 [Planctomycetota bacterium]